MSSELAAPSPERQPGSRDQRRFDEQTQSPPRDARRSLNRPAASARPVARPWYRPTGTQLRVSARPTAPRGEQPLPRRSSPRGGLAGRIARLGGTMFINRNFAVLWWGQAISSVGDYAWDTALVLWVATFLVQGRSWAPLAISGVILAAVLPQVVAGPLAGVFVDRWDKRRTMIVTTGLQAAFAILLIAPVTGLRLPLVGSTRLPVPWELAIIYADVALITICSQFFIPAQFALIKDIVPGQKEDQALETSQAIQGIAVILGPPLAAGLVFGLGVQWALLLNALSFVVSFVAASAIQAPPAASSLAPGETGRFSREFVAGFGYVLRHTILRTILVSEVLTWLGFGALQTLGYFFITENLHSPAGDYGLLGADFGLGAIAGALIVTFLGHRVGLARLLWMALVTSGIFVTVLSHLTSFALALGAAFLFGVSATAILVTAGPLALHATSREFVGRVTAVINPIGKLAALLSVAIAGYLVSAVLGSFHATVLGVAFGPVDTVFTGMGLLAVAGGLYARVALRDVIAAEDAGKEDVGEGRGRTSEHQGPSARGHTA